MSQVNPEQPFNDQELTQTLNSKSTKKFISTAIEAFRKLHNNFYKNRDVKCFRGSPHAWRWSLRLQPRAPPGTPGSETWRTDRTKNSEKRPLLQANDQKRSLTHQFEHPGAAAAGGEAAEQAENNDDGSGSDEDVWRVGAVVRNQREIGLQADLPPHPDSQQDHTCELKTAGRAISEPRERTGVF